MRKIYRLASLTCLGLVLSSQNTNAQVVSGFESLTLSTDTYFNGSDLSGVTTPTTFTTNFLSGDATFTNVWDTTYGVPGFWSTGFVQSSMTDSITSGSGNLFSTRAGSGNNSSLTYLVAKQNSQFTLKNTASDTLLTGIHITNGTYAANSMRDGDLFAKQFGGMTGNDPDWFLLTIKGLDSSGVLTADSVNFYLADYRFANNTLDYIIKDWQFVDLTPLGNVVSLTFKLTSSDVGAFGMNTPAFFCMDDVNSASIASALIDFEDLGFIASDSVWNGNDYSGTPNDLTYRTTFADGDAEFKNVWNIGFGGYWQSGVAYSNKTDSTTSGFSNIYSAKAAGGARGSDNYLIVKNNAKAYLTGAAVNNTVSGVYLTNGTYAANSMRDGDAFAKKFGGATGNDADWFLVTIKGYTSGALTTDSINFYLSDYRFTDNAQDYIVKDWQWVDLTTLGNIDSLTFSLSSSDVGAFGMNTPAFFALDNLNDQTVSVKEIDDEVNFSIYPNPTNSHLYVNLKNKVNTLQIIDVTGKIVASTNNLQVGEHKLDLNSLNSGLYFVKTISDNSSNVVRLIKQ